MSETSEKKEIQKFQIFYSWQSDLPGNVTKSFIEACIEKAVKEINKENDVALFAGYTRDTEGETGSEDIVETICKKIDESDMFIGDISFVGKNDCDENCELLPNPNVLVESGYATHSLGRGRVVFVCNTAFGDLGKMPFDIRNRTIIKYNLKDKNDSKNVEEEKKLFIARLKKEIKGVIEKGKNPSNKPKIHDVELFKKFREEMPHRQFIHFLEKHDVLDYYRDDDLKLAYDFVCNWTGADNDFSDAQASFLLNEFKKVLKKICTFYAKNLISKGGDLLRVRCYDSDEECEKIQKEYYPLADSIIKTYNNLVYYGNKHLVL